MHAFVFHDFKSTSEYIEFVGATEDKLVFLNKTGDSIENMFTSDVDLSASEYSSCDRTRIKLHGSSHSCMKSHGYFHGRGTEKPLCARLACLRLCPKSDQIVALYENWNLICLSSDGSIMWARSLEQTLETFALSPDESTIIIPTIRSICLFNSEDGSLASSVDYGMNSADTRIVSIDWTSLIMVAHSNGIIHVLRSTLSVFTRMDCGETIYSASLELNASLVAACTCESIHIYSVKSSQKLLSIKLADSEFRTVKANWIPASGDKRLAITVDCTVQLVTLKTRASVCCFNEHYIAYIQSETDMCVVNSLESSATKIPLEYKISSICGNVEQQFFVISLSGPSDSIMRFLDSTGQQCMEDRVFEGSSIVHVCDYTDTTMACTDGVFAILFSGDGSISWISIHSPIESQPGKPPLCSTYPRPDEEDLIVDICLSRPKTSLAVARKSGIIQCYEIREGCCMRMIRSVRACTEFGPEKMILRETFSVILDEGSNVWFGGPDLSGMKKLTNRSVCWRMLACPGNEFVAVSDRDSVFVYKVAAEGYMLVLDALRVGVDTELISIYDSEMMLFNWRTKIVSRVPLRHMRDWNILRDASAPTRALVDYVHANSCMRLWTALGVELVHRGEYKEGMECFVRTKDWIGTVLVGGLERGIYSRDKINILDDNDGEITPPLDDQEWELACGSWDTAKSCDWKSFSYAGIELLCDSLLREGNTESLAAVLQQTNRHLEEASSSFQDFVHALVLSGQPETAIRVCVSQKALTMAMELAITYDCWDSMRRVIEGIPLESQLDERIDSVQDALKNMRFDTITLDAKRCLVAVARRCTSGIALVILSIVSKNGGLLVKHFCELISWRLCRNDVGGISKGIVRYINAHVALYAGDYEMAYDESWEKSLSESPGLFDCAEEQILALQALTALLCGRRPDCSMAFRMLQTKSSISETNRKIYRNLSFKVFSGASEWSTM